MNEQRCNTIFVNKDVILPLLTQDLECFHNYRWVNRQVEQGLNQKLSHRIG